MNPKKLHHRAVRPVFDSEILPTSCFSRIYLSLLLTVSIATSAGFHASAQQLQFLQPTNGAVFSTRDEIPIVLRASAPNDVFFSADVFANVHRKIGTAVYCCPTCLCVRPEPGQPT